MKQIKDVILIFNVVNGDRKIYEKYIIFGAPYHCPLIPNNLRVETEKRLDKNVLV